MDIEERAKQMTKAIYDGYGSDTHVLFGIPSDCMGAVNTIIKLVLQKEDDKNECKETKKTM